MRGTPQTNLFGFKGHRDLAFISCQCWDSDLHVDDRVSDVSAEPRIRNSQTQQRL